MQLRDSKEGHVVRIGKGNREDFYPAVAMFSHTTIMCLLALVVLEFRPKQYFILILSILVGAIIMTAVFLFDNKRERLSVGLPIRPKDALFANYLGGLLIFFGYGCFSVDIIVLLSAVFCWVISFGSWPKWWILSFLGVSSGFGFVAILASLPIMSWLISKYGK